MLDVVLVEDSAAESALAAVAIALRRPGTRVHEARDLDEALRLFAKNNALAILGWRALKDAPAQLVDSKIVCIGFAAQLSKAEGQRAIEAGVRAIYERPRDWRPYCDALERMLNEWLGGPARP